MKRVVAVFLILAFLISMTGCETAESGSAACGRFLQYLKNGEYASAYAMLSAQSRNDTEESKINRVTEQEFIDKYTNIFEALDIVSISFDTIEVTEEGSVLAAISYTAVYRSVLAGDLRNDFKLTAVMQGGSWRVEWTPANIFPDMTWGDTVRVATIAAKRGEILSDGRALAATIGATSVYAVPSIIDDEAIFCAQVSPLLGLTVEEVSAALKKAYNDVAVLKTYYSDELLQSVHEQLLSVKGIGIDDGNFKVQREYPFKSLLAHVLGYVAPISAESTEELEALIAELNDRIGDDSTYNSDSIVGKLGLERQYETELHGKNGKEIFIFSAAGEKKRTLYKENVENGMDIELTVNIELQKRVEELMELVLYGETTAGAVVVMNPLTGEIQAIASYPTYDLNLFVRGISQKDYDALINYAAKPLINRTTQGLYPPGSVFKAFTAAAALESGALSADPDEQFKGHIEDDYWEPTEFGTWIWPRIKRAYMRYRTEPLNMHNAIINSDNIYFANAALLIGEEPFFNYMKSLGMEESIPFDIYVAKPQLVNENTDITPKLLADSGYGQGEILVTPLQLASMFSMFANGGDIIKPRIVRGLYEENGFRIQTVSESETETWRENVVPDSVISEILPMLKDVVSKDYNGTGHALKVNSCEVAAKTGTAEIGSDKSREISWFAGFRTGVSEENARLVLVMLEVPVGTEYSTLKFDIARELLKMASPGTIPEGDAEVQGG
ncbi:MAG TPA: penicillin-binding transpeptidase domain-containing protein [Clostridia bacterium]|nr:penicillin-binding transpeptidase domain-containing protein [Clostridia bacterium]